MPPRSLSCPLSCPHPHKPQPGRTDVQCRERWCNVLDPSLDKGQWTPEEDARLLELAVSNTGADGKARGWASVVLGF